MLHLHGDFMYCVNVTSKMSHFHGKCVVFATMCFLINDVSTKELTFLSFECIDMSLIFTLKRNIMINIHQTVQTTIKTTNSSPNHKLIAKPHASTGSLLL